MTFKAASWLKAICANQTGKRHIQTAASIGAASVALAGLASNGLYGGPPEQLVMLPPAPPPVYAQSGKISDRLPNALQAWMTADIAPVSVTLARLQVATRPGQTIAPHPTMLQMESVFGIRSIESPRLAALPNVVRQPFEITALPRKAASTKGPSANNPPVQIARSTPRPLAKPIAIASAAQTPPVQTNAAPAAASSPGLGSTMTILVARGASAVVSVVTRAGGAAADLIGLSGQS